jgi:hypothetical protein
MTTAPTAHRHARVAVPLAALLLLASCGGGGGGDGGSVAVPPSTVCTGSAAYEIVARAQAALGKNAMAAVAGCTGAIGNPRWSFIGGPATPTVLADRTQTISFDPPAAGTYTFRVDFVDPAQTARSENVSVVVAAGATSLVAARASHSVRMGANVSVRAWPTPSAGANPTVSWTQLDGPAVTFLPADDPYAAIFTAPAVSRDTPVRLRATVRTAGGATDSDDVLVMIERHDQAPSCSANGNRIWCDEHVSRVYPYKAASPYASALVPCAYSAAQDINAQCPLSQLPFLAQETGGALPSVAQVMNRVLVSHDWLGQNFENFLNSQDVNGDFRRMLLSTTAVVLGTHVRPSFYYAVTGAIYLDADNFWLTPEQRDLVSEVPDFRSDFDRDLGYSGLWRYVQGNQSIFVFFNPRSRVSRSVSYLLNESGWLMYHELGHALDFLPPSAYAGLVNNLGPWDNISPRFPNQLTSTTVGNLFPLTSTVMRGLAQVKFFGVTADPTQRAYTPDQVAGFFSADIATDEYNYSNGREDIAMTLEELLMNRRLGIQRDKAITDKIGPSTTGSTLIVRWGQRGRVGAAGVKPRAKAIAQALVPWFDANQVDTLPAPLPMRAGDSWIGNLSLPSSPPPGGAPTERALSAREQSYRLKRELQRMEHHHHAQGPRLPPAATAR